MTVTTLSATGCTRNGSTSTVESTTTTNTETDTQQQEKMDEIAYTTKEVRGSQVLKDGISTSSNRHQHVVLLESETETDRLESEQLDSETTKFVSETSFGNENLLVLQVILPSSAMEFTVETVGVLNEQIHVWTEYVSNPGPQNEILETELIQFAVPSDQSITGVVIHAENYPYNDQKQTTFTPSN